MRVQLFIRDRLRIHRLRGRHSPTTRWRFVLGGPRAGFNNIRFLLATFHTVREFSQSSSGGGIGP
jgi:hypothetical protein